MRHAAGGGSGARGVGGGNQLSRPSARSRRSPPPTPRGNVFWSSTRKAGGRYRKWNSASAHVQWWCHRLRTVDPTQPIKCLGLGRTPFEFRSTPPMFVASRVTTGQEPFVAPEKQRSRSGSAANIWLRTNSISRSNSAMVAIPQATGASSGQVASNFFNAPSCTDLW